MTEERAYEVLSAFLLDQEELGQDGNAALDQEQLDALYVARDNLRNTIEKGEQNG